MALSLTEKKEISDYVFAMTMYIETYNEVYDHILSVWANETAPYHMDRVMAIVNHDFGGIAAIKRYEEAYQKQIKRRYIKLIGREMLYTFKLANILPNLILVILCYALYNSSLNLTPLFKLIYMSVLSLIVLAGLYWLTDRYFLNSKTKKDSIRVELVFGLLFLPVSIINIFFNTMFAHHNELTIALATKNLTILIIFFFMSIYIRSFIKLYAEKIKVLAI